MPLTQPIDRLRFPRETAVTIARRALLTLAFALALVGCRSIGDPSTIGSVPDAVPVAGDATLALSAPPADWDVLVGRRVRIDAPLTLSGSDPRRPGELVASFGGRLFTPTEIAAPGDAAAAVARDNARRRLRVLPPPAANDLAVAPTSARVGTQLSGLAGELVRDDAGIALRPSVSPRVAPAPRPAPPTVPGDVRLASFNLENLFNGDGRGGGFPTPRGARTPAEFDAQLGKLVATITALQPDVAALMELENDGDGAASAAASLVDALNTAAGTPGDWRAVPSAGLAGGDQIRVGLAYRSRRIVPVGSPASVADGPFARGSRPPLAQAFRAGPGPVFVVVANHFKSKGCGNADGADRDLGDGQACYNAARQTAARRLDAWLATDPTRSGSDLVAIVGDFNAYAQEDPLRQLRAAGWRDALQGAAEVPYSYVFQAQSGRLDHALLSPALAARLAGAAEWHTNADEPDAPRDAAIAPAPGAATPWRSSDHDPLLIGLRLRER